MSDNLFGETIFSYSRKQAIEDGNLIDITETSNARGFKLPCAISIALFQQLEEDLDRVAELLDVMFAIVRINNIATDRVVMDDIVLHIGPGDDSKPVLTLCHLVDL